MKSDFPKDKKEAIRKLTEEKYQILPGQDFQIDRMEPEDAWGVARCFYEVYGEHYPFDHYYVPEKLVAADRSGDMIGIVARTTKRDIIGFGSLFRNFAHNPRIYENGQATVIPDYRSTLAIICIQDYIFDTITDTVGIDIMFGEPVCNHLIMQKIASLNGFYDTGIELGVMPGETYHKGSPFVNRVSTVMSFKVIHDRPHGIYLPVEYEALLRSMISKMPLSRNAAVSSDPVPQGSVSSMDARYFEASQVLRLSICATGRDFESRLADEEAQAKSKGVVVFQVFVNLDEPWCGKAVTILRKRGFFFGGFLPQWFGSDGLLMQKLAALPDFNSVLLLTEDNRKLLDDIKADIECCRSLETE
ncbi:MAG: hypothetical protein HY881_21685 [Deltaproteobacteria bacterium]|nr:hypothetical protein [Deltaproteobacteria bacterium]